MVEPSLARLVHKHKERPEDETVVVMAPATLLDKAMACQLHTY